MGFVYFEYEGGLKDEYFFSTLLPTKTTSKKLF